MTANSNDTMNLAAAATSTYSSTFNANAIPSEGTNGSSAASNMNLPSMSTYNMNLSPTSIYNTNLPPRSSYNIPAAWSAEKRPRLSDIFMSLAEGRFENENFDAPPTRFMELQSRTDLPIVRFPSLDPRQKRNSAKRRKRDKQIPLHNMTTVTDKMSAILYRQMNINERNDSMVNGRPHSSLLGQDHEQKFGEQSSNSMEQDVVSDSDNLKSSGEEENLHGTATEEQLTGIATEEQLTGIATEEQLTGTATEEQLTGIATEEQLQGRAAQQGRDDASV